MNPLLWLEQAPVLAPLVGMLVGVMLAVSPLAWPMAVATVAAGVAASGDGRVPVRILGAVGAGIVLVYVTLGVAVGAIDTLVRDVLGAGAGLAMAILAVATVGLGAFVVARPSLACRLPVRRPGTATSAGVAYGVALSAVTCPACAGVVTGVAVSAAAGWGATSAALAMLGLGIGHVLALALLVRLAQPFLDGPRSVLVAQRVAGGVLVAVGAFFGWQAMRTGLEVATVLP